jgi:hypothetical protein
MTVQLSVAARNGMLDALETAVGLTAVLRIFSGAQPANCAAANSGTELWNKTLASDWMSAASSASKSFSGTPLTANAIAGAPTNAGHYRLYASDGTTCHEQGSITATGSGGDMTLDNISIASGQSVSVTSWTQNMSAHA